MTLQAEIEWWTKNAFKSDSNAAFVAFGVATGLKLAKRDYGAKDNATVLPPDRTDDDLSQWAAFHF